MCPRVALRICSAFFGSWDFLERCIREKVCGSDRRSVALAARRVLDTMHIGDDKKELLEE